ncbi:MAG: hypothetical protein ABJN69_09565 [Hellea sp.]
MLSRRLVLSSAIIAALSTTAFAFGPKDNAVPITDFYLTNLQNNETLEVTYGSQGCFHSDSANIVFQGSNVSIKSIGTRELSLKELKRVENYFAYVDGLDGIGGCTTQTTMTLTRKRNGLPVSSKSLIDGTCGFGLNDKDDFLSLGQLKYELEEPAPKVSKWTEEP